MRTLAAFLTLACLLPMSGQAAEYKQLVADKSSIHFGYKQMGVAMNGRFTRFSAELAVDPAQPAKARARIEIDLASIDTGSAEADQEVAGKLWFNTKTYPRASFVAHSIKPVGANRYEVAGTLTIKGKTHNVVVPATFTPQGNTGVFDGSLTIRRGDFTIGEGPWAAFDIVANDIQIKFRIAASGK